MTAYLINASVLSVCNVIPVSAEISSLAAGYQRNQSAKRKMADFLIEATAETNGLHLATRNPQDFKHAGIVCPYRL